MIEIRQGDCLEVMKTMADNSIDFVVTDPPYGLHFMGKSWDKFKKSNFDEKCDHKIVKRTGEKNPHTLRKVRAIYSANAVSGSYDETRNDEFQEFIYKVGLEILRILKPGSYIAMFGAPRRHHRQMSGLEDAGFEIRDCLMWLFGQGFPKSHNHFGLEGYGTALKPAWEPIILAMKPCEGTFKQNAEKWGLAGINIYGTRIGNTREVPASHSKNKDGIGMVKMGKPSDEELNPNKGRWPANLILDEEAAQMLDLQSGILKSPGSGKNRMNLSGNSWKNSCKEIKPNTFLPPDSGGASRFFYCAKTSSSERNAGLENMPLKSCGMMEDDNYPIKTGSGNLRDTKRQNTHPTVKPLSLMRYLITLLAPPGKPTLLDPFAGSGSTLVAAKQLGINAIGIELEPEYVEIAQKRVDHTTELSEQYEMNFDKTLSKG